MSSFRFFPTEEQKLWGFDLIYFLSTVAVHCFFLALITRYISLFGGILVFYCARLNPHREQLSMPGNWNSIASLNLEVDQQVSQKFNCSNFFLFLKERRLRSASLDEFIQLLS